jgi:uncharacterized membrane protein YidH (DUF202 family)
VTPGDGADARDPGLAFERTTLAWHRTGLSSLAAAALAVHSYRVHPAVAFATATLLAGLAALAYRTGATAPTTAARIRTMSLGVTIVAALAVAGTIVG